MRSDEVLSNMLIPPRCLYSAVSQSPKRKSGTLTEECSVGQRYLGSALPQSVKGASIRISLRGKISSPMLSGERGMGARCVPVERRFPLGKKGVDV